MRIIKLSIMLLLCLFSTLTLAAYHQGQMRPKPPMNGWYTGAGVGFSSLMTNYSNVTFGDYQPVAYQATVNNLFPAIQAGYWGRFRSWRGMWGVKAFYKYLAASTNYVMSENNNWYVNQDTKVTHELALLYTLGFCLKRVNPYLGLGIMWLPTVRDVIHNTSLGTGADFNVRKSLLGGIVQLGFLYNITPNWFLDTVYSIGFTGRGDFNQRSDGDTINRKIRVTAQEIMLSINRRF